MNATHCITTWNVGLDVIQCDKFIHNTVTYDLSPCFIYPVLQLLTQNEIRKKEKELEDNLRHLKILETVSMQQVWWEMAVCDFAVPVAVPNLHPVFRCSTKCRNLCSNVMSALLKDKARWKVIGYVLTSITWFCSLIYHNC
jgi:hypothetical protein